MFVYILASKTRVLYVGVTADLLHRMWEHLTGAMPGFTCRYGVNRLVYYETTDNRQLQSVEKNRLRVGQG